MDWLWQEVSNLEKQKLFRVWLFRELLNYKKRDSYGNNKKYKEIYAREIIVTAFQKHISQLKNNYWATFYFYSFCRKSDRQFLVVQMHFLSIWALWLLFLLKYMENHEKELGRSKLEWTLLKDRSRHLSLYHGQHCRQHKYIGKKSQVWPWTTNSEATLLSWYTGLARRLFPNRHNFSPCSLYVSLASATFV